MKLRDISIKYSYMIIVLCIVAPLYLLFSAIHYSYVKNGILTNSQLAVRQSQRAIIETIQSTERSYEFIADNYEGRMRDALAVFERAYEAAGRNVDAIDLEAIKKSFNDQMDLYVIDAGGVITHTTLPGALGIDFSKIPDFYAALQSIRAGNAIEISKVTMDLRSRELRKWGYLPTKDHRYILEVGIAPDVLAKYIQKIDYLQIDKLTREANAFIRQVRVFDIHYNDLGSGKQSVDAALNRIIDRVMADSETYRTYLANGFVEREYVFVNTFSNALNDSKKVLEITFNYDDVVVQLDQLMRGTIMTFFGYTLVSLLIMYWMTSRYITSPLVRLTSMLQKVGGDNLAQRVEVASNNEIGQLGRTFNAVAERLQSTVVSQHYLENVIDTVGDLVVILDSSLVVVRANKFTRTLLGVDWSEFIGQPASRIFAGDYSPEALLAALGAQDTLPDQEFLLRTRSGRPCHVLATFSTLRNPAHEVIGYVCNAKDITRTKERLDQLTASNERLIAEEQALLDQSQRDYLTGIYNRRFALASLDALVARNEVAGTFSVIMLDIDHFKHINDTYGHPAGDEVLRQLVRIIGASVRNVDHSSRFGGEEFLIILPDATAEMALAIAERIRVNIDQTVFLELGLHVTVSGGCAEWQRNSVDELIKRADELLYRAKQSGRNRICA